MRNALEIGRAFVLMFFRDRVNVFFTLFFNAFLMIALGLTVEDRFNVRVTVGVADLARTPVSDSLVARLAREPNLRVVRVATEDDVRRRIREGSLVAGVLFQPRGAGADAVDGLGVTLLSDPSRRVWTRLLQPGLTIAMLESDPVGRAGVERVHVAWEAAPSRNVRYFDFIFPGVVAFAVMQVAFAGAMSLLHHRKNDALKRLKLTPLARWQFLTGYGASQLVVLAAQITLYWLLAAAFFGYRAAGPTPQIALVTVLGAFEFVGLGLLIANLAPTVEAGANLVRFLTFPAAFLCGVFVPSDALPRALSAAASAYPLTGFVSALRASANYGAPFGAVALRIGVMLAVGIVSILIAIRLFRWEEQAA
jgi:ABC-2 type transport system permease protein